MGQSRLVYGEDERVAHWARVRIPGAEDWNGGYRAIGLERDGKLIAAAVYTDVSLANLSMHIAGEGNWASRKFLRAIFAYPFVQLKVRRVTGYISAKNWRSRKMAEQMGGTLESIMERALMDDDVCVYRIFNEHCRWTHGISGR